MRGGATFPTSSWLMRRSKVRRRGTRPGLAPRFSCPGLLRAEPPARQGEIEAGFREAAPARPLPYLFMTRRAAQPLQLVAPVSRGFAGIQEHPSLSDRWDEGPGLARLGPSSWLIPNRCVEAQEAPPSAGQIGRGRGINLLG